MFVTPTHKLLVLAWLKYVCNDSSAEPSKFNASKLATYMYNYLIKERKKSLTDLASEDTLRKDISGFKVSIVKKRNPNQFSGLTLQTFITFCHEIQENEVIIDKVISENSVEILKNYYSYVTKNKSLHVNIFEHIINNLFIKTTIENDFSENQDDKFLLPQNLQPSTFCQNLEFGTHDIVVNVITPDLDWACFFIEKIIESVKNHNAHYYYLLTTSDPNSKIKMETILKRAREEKIYNNIQVRNLADNSKVHKNYNGSAYKRGKSIFEPAWRATTFPLPYDLVVYENIPNNVYDEISQQFFGRLSKNKLSFIGAVGTPPYTFNNNIDYEKKETYYDVLMHSRDAEKVLHWFNHIWEAITGIEKKPLTLDNEQTDNN